MSSFSICVLYERSLVYAIFYFFLSFSLSSERRVYFQFANRPFWGKTRKNPCRMLRPVCTKEPKPIRKNCCAVWVLELWHGNQRGVGCPPWRSSKVNGTWCWAAVLGGPAGGRVRPKRPRVPGSL